MLELIFQGFIEWIYGLILECWEYFSSVLLNVMSMDFAYLRERIPVIDPIMQSMLAVGWALLIGNLVFQSIRTMATGLGFEGEDPKLLFTRTFVFAFLLFASPQICHIALNMTSTVIELIEMPTAVEIKFADDASFLGMAAAWLLVVICGIVVMFQSFGLIFEMAERYFILAVLTICSPLAFSMGGSRSTSDIFSGWCRMYGSMCLLTVLNVVFVKMLLSVLSFYPSGLDVLPWMVLVITIVKVAKKLDALITRIGLNPAMTGDPLGRGIPGALTYTVVRGAAAGITKTIGGMSGSRKPSGSRNTSPGGSEGGRNTAYSPHYSSMHNTGGNVSSQEQLGGTSINANNRLTQGGRNNDSQKRPSSTVPRQTTITPAEGFKPQLTGAHSGADAVRNGTAGIGAAHTIDRTIHSSAQNIRGGSVNNSVQTSETNSARSPGTSNAGKPQSGSPAQRSGSGTRFTSRIDSQPGTGRNTGSSSTAPTISATATRHDSAGTGSFRSVPQTNSGTPQRRNSQPVSTPAATSSARSRGTVPQERPKLGQAAVKQRQQSPDLHHGTAGTTKTLSFGTAQKDAARQPTRASSAADRIKETADKTTPSEDIVDGTEK